MKGIDKQSLSKLQEKLNKYMQTDPLFMLFCPLKTKREDFADKYFSYYLEKWAEKDQLLMSDSRRTAVTLIDPKTFKYRFSGKNALSMKLSSCSYNVFAHQNAVEEIVNIIIPVQKEKRVLTIYGNPAEHFDEIMKLVKECMKKAEDEGFVLVYETLSKKLVTSMEAQGFEISYAKQFMNTQFFQTLMTYNF